MTNRYKSTQDLFVAIYLIILKLRNGTKYQNENITLHAHDLHECQRIHEKFLKE